MKRCYHCDAELPPDSRIGLCPVCDEKNREEIRRTRREEAVERVLEALPKRYHWCTFDAPELGARVKDASAIAAAKSALEADRVVFMGPAGAGKTVLASCLLRARAEAATRSGVFVDAYELGQARANSTLGHEPELIERAVNASCLVLDDLGAEPSTALSPIPEVIFRRHEQMRPYIVTTGFKVEELRAKYGDGILRRVFEHATVIAMKAAPKAGKGGT